GRAGQRPDHDAFRRVPARRVGGRKVLEELLLVLVRADDRELLFPEAGRQQTAYGPVRRGDGVVNRHPDGFLFGRADGWIFHDALRNYFWRRWKQDPPPS